LPKKVALVAIGNINRRNIIAIFCLIAIVAELAVGDNQKL
jgi:hypothetical protein